MKTKKVFAILISALLLIGLLPMTALAAWDAAPAINMTASQDGDQITVEVSVAAAADLSAFGFNMSYPTEQVTLKSTAKQLQRDNNGFYTALDDEGEPKGDQATVNIATAGTVAFQIAIDSNTSFAKDAVILKVVFTVKEGATGRIEFGLSDLSAGSAGKGSYNYTEEETPTAAIVPPISAITLSGTVTTPAKGVEDKTALTPTPDDVTVTTAWTPTLEGGKFAAKTEYTLTITVAPKSGATLTDDCTVTYSGYTFEKSGTSFVATKTFEKTADKSIVGLTATEPTKKDYVYGEEFDKASVTVTATFDDESTATVTDYTVSELKVGDTTATITYQGKTVTVEGLTVSKADNPAKFPTATVTVTFEKEKDLKTLVTDAEGAVTFTAGALPTGSTLTEAGLFTAGTTEGDCTVTAKAAGNDNYKEATATFTVSVISKPAQENFAFAKDTEEKTYGDAAFTVTAAGQEEGSTVTYASGDEKIATVDETSGEVTIVGAGTVTITATASETEEFAEATATLELTVSKAAITVTAIDKTVVIGGEVPSLAEPELDKDYKVAGLVGEDALKGTVKLAYQDEDGAAVTPDTAAEGVYVIAFDCTAASLNPNTDNYTDPVLVNGKLTVSLPASGGGSSTSATTYEPVITADHGKVTVDPAKAKATETVKITLTADEGYELDSLTVTDASGTKIDFTANADGTYSFKQPAAKVTITAKFKEKAEPKANNPFTDVKEGDYFYDAVMWAVDRGITTGTTPTTFSPMEKCTRGQLVTFMWRAAGSPEPNIAANPFTDVATDAYYYKAVLWAYENKITQGTTDTTFSPDAPVTRGQTVTFLYRWKGAKTEGAVPFTDLEAGAFYNEAVAWAYSTGVTKGLTDTLFGPEENCLRGQIVTFLYRAANLK